MFCWPHLLGQMNTQLRYARFVIPANRMLEEKRRQNLPLPVADVMMQILVISTLKRLYYSFSSVSGAMSSSEILLCAIGARYLPYCVSKFVSLRSMMYLRINRDRI